MVSMGWLYLSAASCLMAAVTGDDSVGVTMCCPEGRVLKLVMQTNSKLWIGNTGKKYSEAYFLKFARSRRAPKDTRNCGAIIVTDEDGF